MAETIEKTFIMIKPDGVQRGLVGKVIQRFEEKGFKLIAMKFIWPSKELWSKHYAEHANRSFFKDLIKYMSSGPVVPMVWEGTNAVKNGRLVIGASKRANSEPGTIRGDHTIKVGCNVVHGSDSVESAKREIALWFAKKEIAWWWRDQEEWIMQSNET